MPIHTGKHQCQKCEKKFVSPYFMARHKCEANLRRRSSEEQEAQQGDTETQFGLQNSTEATKEKKKRGRPRKETMLRCPDCPKLVLTVYLLIN